MWLFFYKLPWGKWLRKLSRVYKTTFPTTPIPVLSNGMARTSLSDCLWNRWRTHFSIVRCSLLDQHSLPYFRSELKDAKRDVTLHYMYKTEKVRSHTYSCEDIIFSQPAPNPIEHMKKLSIDSSKTSNVLLVDKLDLIDYSKGERLTFDLHLTILTDLYTLVREQREMNSTDIHIIQTADVRINRLTSSSISFFRCIQSEPQCPRWSLREFWLREEDICGPKRILSRLFETDNFLTTYFSVTTSFIVMSAIPERSKLQRRDRIHRQQRQRRHGVKPGNEWCQREIEILLKKSSQKRKWRKVTLFNCESLLHTSKCSSM